jgi:hypothetical protein
VRIEFIGVSDDVQTAREARHGSVPLPRVVIGFIAPGCPVYADAITRSDMPNPISMKNVAGGLPPRLIA